MWCRGVGHSDESDDDEGRVCGWLWGLYFPLTSARRVSSLGARYYIGLSF